MESFLLLASVYLGAAVLIVPISVRLGLGSVLGYLAAGILMGPVLGLAGTETADLQHFAEFGVVMMLFLIGLELEPRALWNMRHRLLGLGGMQILLTTGGVTLAVVYAGLPWQIGMVLGMILSLSSTAIVLQSLNEKNLMRTTGGRSAFAVLLTQDVAVVPMLAIIPLLSAGAANMPEGISAATFGITNPGDTAEAHAAPGAAEPLLSFIHSLPGWAVTLMTLGIVVGIILAGHFLTRPVFRFVHASRLPEMGTFIALLMVFGIAFLMMIVGLSPALGTFLAGVVLANSEFRHQLEADIAPFKGILMGLFFMTVGVGIDFMILAASPVLVIALTLALIALKAAVLFLVSLPFRLKGTHRWLFTLSLAQAGEFGFLITAFATKQSALTPALAQITLLVISLSMLLTPLLFIFYDRLAAGGSQPENDTPADEIDERGRVIIAGIGRFGQLVNRLVRMAGAQTVVLDSNIETIQMMRRFGIKGFFGDPTRPELLEAAGLREASVLVIAVNDREAITRIVHHARQQCPDLHIIARARDRIHVYELYRAGADDIVRETFDSSLRAGRYVLENIGLTEYEAARLSQTYFQVEREALRDLAELWVPGRPIQENEPYIARSRQLDEDLALAVNEDVQETRQEARQEAAE
ncbi:MAG: cation:proton antiporter [Pseudorhodobacter sp.]